MTATLPDGTKLTVERSGKTDEEAFSKLQALRDRPFGPTSGRRWTMAKVWEDWWNTTSAKADSARVVLADGARSRSPLLWQDSTRIRYRGIWNRHLAGAWGPREPRGITRAELYEWLHSPDREVKPSGLLDTLRIVFKHAQNIGISENPTAGGFGLTTERPRPRPLTEDELDAIEERLLLVKPQPRQPDARRLYDGWGIVRSTGARISEMLACQVQDWIPADDGKSGTLHLGRRHQAKAFKPTTGKSTIVVIEGTKTRAGVRPAPVSPAGAAILNARCEGRAPTDFIIANADGSFVSTNAFSNLLFREMQAIGIKATAHDLRDTISTTIARELVARRGWQAGLLAAARHLGHASTKTLPHYLDEGQVVDADVAQVVSKMMDPAQRRLASIQEIALGLNLAGLGVADVLDEGAGLRVNISCAPHNRSAWETALSRFRADIQITYDGTGRFIDFSSVGLE